MPNDIDQDRIASSLKSENVIDLAAFRAASVDRQSPTRTKKGVIAEDSFWRYFPIIIAVFLIIFFRSIL